MRSYRIALAAVCLLYLGHRLLLLYTNFDATVVPSYEVHQMGNIGENLLNGWRGAPLAQNYDFCGGHLVSGILAGILYHVVGDSYFALKLVPVLLGLGCLLLMASIAKRWWGPVAGLCAAAFFAIGPPMVAKYSTFAFGSHFEAMFFQMMVLWVFSRLHASQRKLPWVMALGFAAGCSVFFYYGSILLVALIFGTHFLIRWWSRAPGNGFLAGVLDLVLAAGPFLLALTPHLIIRAGRDRPYSFFAANVNTDRWSKGFERGRELVSHWFPQSGCYPDLFGIPGTWAARVALVLAGAIWLIGVGFLLRGLWASRFEAKPLAQTLRWLPLVAYAPAFLAAYCFFTTSLRILEYAEPVREGTFRYFVTFYTLWALLGAGVWASLLKGRSAGTRGVGIAGIGLTLGLGAFSFPMIDWSFQNSGMGTRYPGYHWKYYTGTLLRDALYIEPDGSVRWELERAKKQMADFEPLERDAIAEGMGFNLAFAKNGEEMGLGEKTDWRLEQMLAPFPETEIRRGVARGIGSYLRRPTMGYPTDKAALQRRLVALQGDPLPELENVYEGIAQPNAYPLLHLAESDFAWSETLIEVIPARFAPAYRRGLGRQLAERMQIFPALTHPYLDRFTANLSVPQREELYVGMGLGFLKRGDLLAMAEDWRAWLPKEALPAVWRGVGQGLARLMPSDWQLPDDLLQGLPPEEASALQTAFAAERAR